MKTKLYNHLAEVIATTHQQLQFEAASAVNKMLTLRNWLIGFYIVEYAQKGEDRAKYGLKIEESLAEKLNLDGLSARNIKLFKQFYLVYPNLVQTASAQLEHVPKEIMQTVSAQFKSNEIQKRETVSHELETVHFERVWDVLDYR